MDAERHDEAVALLSEQVQRVGATGSRKDAPIPIDQAWMLVQRARARAEIGEVGAAREGAATARRMLVGEPPVNMAVVPDDGAGPAGQV